MTPSPRDQAKELFVKAYGCNPDVQTWAPGRVEVLGNHTDYNEGLVLSAAIQYGISVAISPQVGTQCEVAATLDGKHITFDLADTKAQPNGHWIDYVRGITTGIQDRTPLQSGYRATIAGDVPPGAGLSSSAALEIAMAQAILSIFPIERSPLQIARLAQKAEKDFAGVNCGLLDQISSLYGRKQSLIHTDFRSLDIQLIPLPSDAAFLVANSGVPHQLSTSEYNERRESCESASGWFAKTLTHPVASLRDVSWQEWETHHMNMPGKTAKRAAHIIGEIDRVSNVTKTLTTGGINALGRCMFESHESSQVYFENSCPELDFIVDACRSIPGAKGARLTGGGFGGGALILTTSRELSETSTALQKKWREHYNTDLSMIEVLASDGAINPTS